MVAARTSDTLLADVRAATQLPDADGRLTTAEIYRITDQAMVLHVADLLSQPRSQRWAIISAGGITSGTLLYRVPDRALGASVLDVLITDGTNSWSAPEIPQEDAHLYTTVRGSWDSPYAYAWRGDRIQILPTPTVSTYSLAFKIARQPSRHVAVSSCAVVASSTSTTITTSATVPSAWTSSQTLDIVRAETGMPWIYTTTLPTLDLAGTSISGTSITVSAGLPSDLPAGCYVCLAGETCVPAIPESVYPVLVHASAMLVLEALGDPRAQSEAALLETAIAVARKLLEPRNSGATQRRVPRFSPLRLMRGWVR